MTNLIIKNARIIGKSDPVQIMIEGDRIVPSLKKNTPTDFIIDADGCLVIPGLINPHTHLDKAGLAEQVKNTSGTVWEARKKMLEIKPNLTFENIKLRAKKVIDESIKNGVTAIRTHVDVDPTIELRGIKAILDLQNDYKDKIDIQIVAFPQEGILESPGTYELMQEALNLGANIVGGHLSIAKDYQEHSRTVFSLAKKFDKNVDIHVDFDIDKDYSVCSAHKDGRIYPDNLGVIWMAEETIRQGFIGRATASHLCGLDSISPEITPNVISLIRTAGISVIALPPGNLFLQGRSDQFRVRRGVTKVKDLANAGVCVSFGPDNIRDPFNPIGSPNMIQNAVLTAYACHMTSNMDFEEVINMCTTNAARIMGLKEYGLKENCFADIVILNASSVEEVLAYQATPRFVIKHGKILFESS